MCRLLAVRDVEAFPVPDQLRALAVVARESKEFQGDGWGCSWWDGEAWRVYHSITPIWEDRLDQFGPTRVLVAHARSAFRNEGIAVENNMPFVDGTAAFAFNGELRGVRFTAPGRIGAEKLFNVIRRFGGDADTVALEHAVRVVTRRTGYIRAMNFVVANRDTIRIGSRFSEDPDYFTMYQKEAGTRRTVCSAPFAAESGWTPIANGALLEWS